MMEKYVDVGGQFTKVIMADAIRSMARPDVQFSYVLNANEDKIKEILEMEKRSNEVLREALEKAVLVAKAKDIPQDSITLAKIAYTLESPLYGMFNTGARQLKTFFDWERFNFKGIWLILYKSLIYKWGEDNLPRSVTVYRGVSIPFQAQRGQIVTFEQFASSSTEEQVARKFLKEPHRSTLFVIKVSNGLQLKKYSRYPEEEEVLLLPNEALLVEDVKKENDLTKIFLKQTEMSLLF